MAAINEGLVPCGCCVFVVTRVRWYWDITVALHYIKVWWRSDINSSVGTGVVLFAKLC